MTEETCSKSKPPLVKTALDPGRLVGKGEVGVGKNTVSQMTEVGRPHKVNFHPDCKLPTAIREWKAGGNVGAHP